MISVGEARRLILSHVTAFPAESVPLLDGLGRVVAEPVVSPVSLPPFENSAMDGFALRSADTREACRDRPLLLKAAEGIRAGLAELPNLEAGCAIPITTGSPLPSAADAVVRIEEARVFDGKVEIKRPVRPGEHVRPSGEDVIRGQIVADVGDILDSARIAMLAGIGCDRVRVYGRPQVAILTTGDELVEPGRDLPPGRIYNSNAYALMAMVREAGCEAIRFEVATDDRQRTQALLASALAADVVVTTGGVSLGTHDFVRDAIAAAGRVHFFAVAQQPGKPMVFAEAGSKAIFGLPGNPVATMVTFEYYVRPALLKMQGHANWDRPRLRVRMCDRVTKRPGRQLFLRAVLDRDARGWTARLTGPQGSGLISSMAGADALLLIPQESSDLEIGSTVEALVLRTAMLNDAWLEN